MSKELTECRFTGPDKGYGVYASRDLPKGTKVWVETPWEEQNFFTFCQEDLREMTVEQINRIKQFGCTIDADMIELSPYVEDWVRMLVDKMDYQNAPCNVDFINHSCAPNLVWEDSRTLVAWRDVREGEELTYDYGTEDWSISPPFECKCGSRECRGVLQGMEWRKEELQQKYGTHFQDHLRTAIEQDRKLQQALS